MPFAILGSPKPSFFDSSGSPLVSGTLSILDPADDTNKASYPDYDNAVALTNANTNPIVLDGRGEPTGAAVGLWGLDGEDYKVVLKDSAGATVWTVDDVRVPIILPYLQTAAEVAAGVTPTNYSYPPGNVLRYGTNTTPGTTDMTTAINNAILVAAQNTGGGCAYLPTGVYAVSEIDMTGYAAGGDKTIKLKGDGRWMTQLVPVAADNVIINLLGSNSCWVQDLSVVSESFTSQCAIFLARSTTSTNCNNNKFVNVFVQGRFSKACVVSNGSESSNWINCRFTNTNVTPTHRCFWSGGSTGVLALQAITVVNGGTVSDVNNPNTDNKMFGVEFYAPYTNATPVRFSFAAGYEFFGCTIICGTVEGAKLVTYGDITGGRFSGNLSWHGCHFEVFGTDAIVHYLDGSGAQVTFKGINSYSGQYAVSNNTAYVDYDRETQAEKPILEAWTFTSPFAVANRTGSTIYAYVLYACDINFFPGLNDGNVLVSGFIQQSKVNTYNFIGGQTRFVNCKHESVATVEPTTGTYSVGETIWEETPVAGQPLGWACTVSGTLGTLNSGSTTGGMTSGSNVLEVNDATGMSEGQHITVAGVSGNPVIRKLSGTTAYLDIDADATVVAAAVAFKACTLVALANL